MKKFTMQLQVLKAGFVEDYECEIFLYIVTTFLNFTLAVNTFISYLNDGHTSSIIILVYKSALSIGQFCMFAYSMDRIEKMVDKI
jgi:hypothetical protein